MKKIIYSKFGGAEVLELANVSVPSVEEKNVLIKVKAVSVNPLDWKIRNGEMKLMSGSKFPRGIGIDFSGIVKTAGNAVTKYKAGDEVFGILDVFKGEALAEYIIASEKEIAIKPSNISFDQAAAMAVVGSAALQIFDTLVKLKKGTEVLINGASGGIGMLLDKYLGSLPVSHNHLQTTELDIHPPVGIISKNVHKGSEQKSTVKLVYSGIMAYSQENRIKLDAMRECLEIRLLERLREDESGVYSPSVSVNTSKYPEGRYTFAIQFGCAPQNVDKLIASANNEVAKLRKNGPLQENLDKWRAEDKASMQTVLKTNFFWRTYLSDQLQNNEPLDQIDQYTGIRDNITVDDIEKMAARYLSGSDYIRLVLLPDLKN